MGVRKRLCGAVFAPPPRLLTGNQVFPTEIGQPLRLSVVVAFHRNVDQLRQCLSALRAAERALPADAALRELVVVANGADGDPIAAAGDAGARLLVLERACGPAVARNRGAELTSGDILVFVDTDVVADEQALARFARLFASQPDLSAAFGAYDERPAAPGFVSQGKNLAHSFVHQRSRGEAQTFWAGLGAVRAEMFRQVGGFDERFARPSVEDIDLGYRIRMAGGRIVLDAAVQGQHLKRWTLRTAIVSDVRDRGVPWTQLLHRYEGLHDDLNVTVAYRACVVIAYLLVASLLAAVRWPIALAFFPVALLALWLLDRPYYRFFASRRGFLFALGWFPLHVLHHLCNGASFVVGTFLYLAQRRRGISLPGAIPLEPWRPVTSSAVVDRKQVEHCVGT